MGKLDLTNFSRRELRSSAEAPYIDRRLARLAIITFL
jgi:hypothetical protein